MSKNFHLVHVHNFYKYIYVKSEKVGVSSLDLLSHMLLYTRYKTHSNDHDNFQWGSFASNRSRKSFCTRFILLGGSLHENKQKRRTHLPSPNFVVDMIGWLKKKTFLTYNSNCSHTCDVMVV